MATSRNLTQGQVNYYTNKITMHKLIFILTLNYSALNCYSQSVPFSIGDTSTYKSIYKTSIQLSEFKFPSYIESISKVGFISINKTDSSLTFFWICKEYKNSATDSGIELDKAIVETIIDFPILFSIKKNGSILIEGDTIQSKESYIRKFNSIAKGLNLNDENDDLAGYLSSLRYFSFPDIIKIKLPEIEIFGKAIAHTLSKKTFEINDKEIFNDIFFDSSDTIKLSKKTTKTITKINSTEIESVYRREVSESELKNYISEKYPKAWIQMKISNPEMDFAPFEEKLKSFNPLYREIVRVLTTNTGKTLKSIEYYNDEEIMLTGGINIVCIISKY